MLNNIKFKKQSGFTLVELLIVIVVIAILAAISIVAYNGIQNRGKSSAAQELASQIQKKAEAYNTVESAYATYAEFTGNSGDNSAGNPAEAKLDDTSKVTDAASTNPGDEKTVAYRNCPTGGGAQVEWYDATSSAVKYIGLGGASSSAACS